MHLLDLLLLAVSLAMDATAAAAARGMAARVIRPRDVARVAGLFGGFQAAMPLLGWGLGAGVGRYVEAWDRWVAFALLTAIGMKMLVEALRRDPDEPPPAQPFAARPLLVLAFATSLDAFAAGVSLAILDSPPALAAGVIGAVTAILSAAGVLLGRRFGGLLGRRLEIAGGLVLVALGVKTLLY